MLGGASAIAAILEEETKRPMSFSFHPQDPATRPIVSLNNHTTNILLQVTAPVRTGRKRKRGSDAPFTGDFTVRPPQEDAQYLLQSLRDNVDEYEIEAVGQIVSTHVWRSMPDFAFATSQNQLLNQLRSKILPLRYPLLKDWKLPRSYGLENTEMIPPPVFSANSVPQNYVYRQNPAVKQIIDPMSGAKKLQNTQAPTKIATLLVMWDTPDYPTAPPEDCPDLATQPHNYQGLVYILNQIFEMRPIWTRRALSNQLPPNAPFFLARYCIAHVAFAIRSGPWRDTYCKFGVDPRTDPRCRKYQTLMLQLVPSAAEKKSERDKEYSRSWVRSKDRKSHVFAGHGQIPVDGKCWQLCDLEDQILKNVVDIPDLYVRLDCERRYFGWYPNGSYSKLKIVLKSKVDAQMGRSEIDDAQFERFLKLPDVWQGPGDLSVDDPMSGFLPKTASKQELEWASAYRSMCRAPPGEVPSSGRLSKTKPKTRESFMESVDAEVRDVVEAQGDQDVLGRFAEPDGGEGDELELGLGGIDGQEKDMEGVSEESGQDGTKGQGERWFADE